TNVSSGQSLEQAVRRPYGYEQVPESSKIRGARQRSGSRYPPDSRNSSSFFKRLRSSSFVDIAFTFRKFGSHCSCGVRDELSACRSQAAELTSSGAVAFARIEESCFRRSREWRKGTILTPVRGSKLTLSREQQS